MSFRGALSARASAHDVHALDSFATIQESTFAEEFDRCRFAETPH